MVTRCASRREVHMLKTKRGFTCMVGLFICWMIVPFYLEGQSEAAPLPVPVQVSPASGTEFHNYPRTFTMTWKKVKDATYEVEIDCLHCKQVGKWDSEVGPPHKLTGITETSASFTFWGDNQGRWRVRAVSGKKNYNDSDWSPWWNFSFKTGQTAQLPDLVIDDMKLDKACNVMVRVKNLGPGSVPDEVWTIHKPESSSVYLSIDGKGWGGATIWKFDPGKSLQPSGGTAIYKSTLKVTGTAVIKATIDHTSQVAEANEGNNARAEKLTCK